MENKSVIMRRILYFAAFLLSLVFMTFYGGHLPYMFFFLLVINAVFFVFHILYSFYSLRISQRIVEHRVDKGKYVKYNIKVSNEGFFTITNVKLNFFDGITHVVDNEFAGSFGLLPGEKIEKDLELVCNYSGTFIGGIDTIEIMDYLGIFKIRFNMPQKMKIVVRPRVLRIDNLSLWEDNNELAKDSSKSIGEMIVDNEVRNYQNGDLQKLIHWRNSIKRGELMVRKFAGEETKDYLIFVDGYIRENNRDRRNAPVIRADVLREVFLSMVNYLTDNNYSVSYAIDDGNCEIVESLYEFRTLTDFITNYVFMKNVNVYERLNIISQNFDSSVKIVVLSNHNREDRLCGEIENLNWLNVGNIDNAEDLFYKKA